MRNYNARHLMNSVAVHRFTFPFKASLYMKVFPLLHFIKTPITVLFLQIPLSGAAGVPCESLLVQDILSVTFKDFYCQQCNTDFYCSVHRKLLQFLLLISSQQDSSISTSFTCQSLSLALLLPLTFFSFSSNISSSPLLSTANPTIY